MSVTPSQNRTSTGRRIQRSRCLRRYQRSHQFGYDLCATKAFLRECEIYFIVMPSEIDAVIDASDPTATSGVRKIKNV